MDGITMKKDMLKQIKETIKDFKDNREFAKYQEKQIEKRYEEKIEDLKLDSNSWHDKKLIDGLTKQMNQEIYNMYEMYGNDSSIHIIYEDGTECCTTGLDIVANECTPKIQHIVYASYLDGYIEYDTETGELDFDVSIDEQLEAREEYFNNIEIKFSTTWGLKHSA
jgi:hypothetical protein